MAGMEWTDLDQAYLDIFGEHPDLSASGPRAGYWRLGTPRTTPRVLSRPLLNLVEKPDPTGLQMRHRGREVDPSC